MADDTFWPSIAGNLHDVADDLEQLLIGCQDDVPKHLIYGIGHAVGVMRHHAVYLHDSWASVSGETGQDVLVSETDDEPEVDPEQCYCGGCGVEIPDGHELCVDCAAKGVTNPLRQHVTPVEVDGQNVMVHGDGPMSIETEAAIRTVIAEAMSLDLSGIPGQSEGESRTGNDLPGPATIDPLLRAALQALGETIERLDRLGPAEPELQEVVEVVVGGVEHDPTALIAGIDSLPSSDGLDYSELKFVEDEADSDDSLDGEPDLAEIPGPDFDGPDDGDLVSLDDDPPEPEPEPAAKRKRQLSPEHIEKLRLSGEKARAVLAEKRALAKADPADLIDCAVCGEKRLPNDQHTCRKGQTLQSVKPPTPPVPGEAVPGPDVRPAEQGEYCQHTEVVGNVAQVCWKPPQHDGKHTWEYAPKLETTARPAVQPSPLRKSGGLSAEQLAEADAMLAKSMARGAR